MHSISHKKKVSQIRAKSLNKLQMQLLLCNIQKNFCCDCSVNLFVVHIVVAVAVVVVAFISYRIESDAVSDYADASHDKLLKYCN